jgi:large subunit ribosomal protein L17
MRHGKKFNHLSRTASHRKALLRNLASALLLSEKKRIITTVAKAKALRGFIEPLITRGKDNTTHSRRNVFATLGNKEAVKEIFGEVAAKVGDRPGGYTRVLKLGARQGDNAEMAMIELVDFNEFATDKPKKKSSRRRKKSKSSADKAVAAPVAEKVVEKVEKTTDSEDAAVVEASNEEE